VWCLEDMEVGSVKTEVCDCKKVRIDQLELQKYEVMSINQPNYKAPGKC